MSGGIRSLLRKSISFFAAVLTISSVILSNAPTAVASTTEAVDVSTSPVCSISKSYVWKEHRFPYPCFVEGTELKIKVPVVTSNLSEIRMRLNDGIPQNVQSGFASIVSADLGLNIVTLEGMDFTNSKWQEIQRIKFIIYRQPRLFRTLFVEEEKKTYAMTLESSVDLNAFVANFGIEPNEFELRRMKNQSGLESAPVLVADLSVSQVNLILESKMTSVFGEEQIMRATAVQSTSSWALDRIDQFKKIPNGQYRYEYTGSGVDIYVIDSGINMSHQEFSGRIPRYWYPDDPWDRTLNPDGFLGGIDDVRGHGTHVAGIAAGSTYGVAKNANVIPIRIWDDADDSLSSWYQAAVSVIISDHDSSRPAVANLSFGSSFNTTSNQLAQNLINDGIVTVIAAGNTSTSALDACSNSPASATNAITVANSTSEDVNSAGSSVGSCVDIFAPGTNVTSAWIGSPTATYTTSGTSMAAPIVAGAAALVLEKNFSSYSNKLNANQLVRDWLVNNSIRDALTWTSNSSPHTSSPNRLVYLSPLWLQNQATLQISNANRNAIPNVAVQLTVSGGSGSGDVSFSTSGTNCNLSGTTLTITAEQSCNVTAIKDQDSNYIYAKSSATTFTAAYLAALTPTFGTPTQTANGFTLPIVNYDSAYTWTVTNSAGGVASISSTGLVTVTGLGANVFSTVTVTTNRTNYSSGSRTSGSIGSLQAALNPTFGTAIPTADGYTVQISNHNSSYVWTATNSAGGSVRISSTGLITVTGLIPGTRSTLTVTTTRTGYAPGTATSGIYATLGAPKIPTFGSATPTLDGFTLPITNYDSAYSWHASSSASTINPDSWRGVTYGNSTYVAVGHGETVITSSDGISWKPRTAASVSNWSSVTFGNGVFVAVSASGAVMKSSDGISWSLSTPGSSNNWTSVTFGNGLFVAVSSSGSNNRVMTSSDGITWTSRTSAANNDWTSVTFGNGLFVAVSASGSNNRVMSSADGINWTSQVSAANEPWTGITFGNELFVAVSGSGAVMTSSDGIAWAARDAGSTVAFTGVSYGANLFVAISSNENYLTSLNGISWTTRAGPANNNWTSLLFANEQFVGVSSSGTNNRVMTSPDGITWTARSSASDNNWSGIAYGNGSFAGVSNDGNVISSRSLRVSTPESEVNLLQDKMLVNLANFSPNEFKLTDTSSVGTIWRTRTTAPTSGTWRGVTSGIVTSTGRIMFVAVNSEGNVMTSPDGAVWTLRPNPVSDACVWRGVTYGTVATTGHGLFVAVSAQCSSTSEVMTSPDGINWTSRDGASNSYQWTSITYGNGLFVAVNKNGSGSGVMTSPDGINWTLRSNGGPKYFEDVTFGNGLFVAVSPPGTYTGGIYTSADGISWTNRFSPSGGPSFSAVAYGNGMYVAVTVARGTRTSFQRVYSSPDGITWTARTAATDNDWYDLVFGNGIFVAVGGAGSGSRVMTSSDGITWTARSEAVANDWQGITYGDGIFVAVSSVGNNVKVMTSSIPRVPGSPAISDVVVRGKTSVRISFTAPPYDGDAVITSYTAISNPGGVSATVTQSNSGFVTVNGLTEGVSYSFTLVATNSVGNSLPSAASINVTTSAVIADAPSISGVSVTGRRTVSINFQAPDSNGDSTIISYVVTSNPGGVTSTLNQAGSGTISVSGLQPDTSYTFTLVAINGVGTSTASAPSASVRTDPPIAPGPPIIGTAIATGTTTATVAFTAPVNDGDAPVTSYTVTADPGGITATVSQSGSGVVTVRGLTPGTSYSFSIVATNLAGTSSESDSSNFMSTIATQTAIGVGSNWRSLTPASGNSWRSITFGNGIFVAVSSNGSGNRVMTSSDGVIWTSRNSAANNSWSSVTFGNGIFVAVSSTGSGNRVMTSPDGIVWTSRSSAADNNWSSVTFGNGIFVAVSTSGVNRVMTSPDGIIWTSRMAATSNNWTSVTYGDGLFVAVSNTGLENRVMTSPDGFNWTLRASPIGENNWTSVTYGNGVYVAVSNSGYRHFVMTSSNGRQWSRGTTPGDSAWSNITFGNGLFVAVSSSSSSQQVMTSTDGYQWTLRSTPISRQWSGTAFGAGTFVAVSATGSGSDVMLSSLPRAPSPPAITSAISAGRTSATISFSAPADGGGVAITSYSVTSSPGNFVASINQSGSGKITVTGLTEGTAYTFKMTATNSIGTSLESNTSTSVIPAPVVPDPPTNVTAATTGRSTAQITFVAPLYDGDSPITSYTATSTPGGISATINQSTSGNITVSGLTPGTNYEFTVTATNSVGTSIVSSPSPVITTNPSEPNAPTIGVATTISSTSARVTFTAPAFNGGAAITSYRATSNPGGFTGSINQSGSGSITISGLRPGTSYSFTVIAINSVGTSLASSASNGITTNPSVPDAPTIGSPSTLGTSSAMIAFTAPTFNGGSAITSYIATSNPGGLTGSVSQSGSGSIVVSGLSPGTSYTFTVKASNSVGSSIASSASTSIVTISIATALATGSSWKSRSAPADNAWRSVTYGNGLFVAVSSSGTGNRVMTSPDGTTWTSRTSAADNNWTSVTYGNGLFVAVSSSGTGNRVMTSPDGTTWTSRTSAADNNWTSVTYGNGLFVAVSSNGTVMTSSNGTSWTSRTAAASNSWSNITYGNGLFVAVADAGVSDRIMASTDGSVWALRSLSNVTISDTGLITVSSLPPLTSSTVTVTTSRTDYLSGSATSTTVSSLRPTYTPTFGTATSLEGGFTLQISNYNNDYTWAATSSAGGQVSISNTGLITVIGLLPAASSTVTVTTTRTGYVSGAATSPIVVAMRGAQQIAFTSNVPTAAKVAGTTYQVSARGGASGNQVVFSAVDPGICSVTGNTVTFITVGTCTISANQEGNSNYFSAPLVQQSFQVSQGNPVLSAFNIGAKTLSDAPFSLTEPVVADSLPGSFTYTSTNPRVAAVTGTTVSIIGSGSTTIRAIFVPDDTVNYNIASITSTITVGVVERSTALLAGGGVRSFSIGETPIAVRTMIPAGIVENRDVSLFVRPSLAAVAEKVAFKVEATDITDGSSVSVSRFNKPLKLQIPNLLSNSAISVGFARSDNIWKRIPVISGVLDEETFCNDQENVGYQIDPTDSTVITIFTCHLTTFGYQDKQATLTVNSSASSILVGGSATLSVVGGSGTGLVSYSAISTPSICSVIGTTVTAISTGSCEISVMKAGDSDYLPAQASNLTIQITAPLPPAPVGGGGGFGGGGFGSGGFAALPAPAIKPTTVQPKLSIISPITRLTLNKVGEPNSISLRTSGGAGKGEVSYSTSTPTICSVSKIGVTVALRAGSCAVRALKESSEEFLEITSEPFILEVVDAIDEQKKAEEAKKLDELKKAEELKEKEEDEQKKAEELKKEEDEQKKAEELKEKEELKKADKTNKFSVKKSGKASLVKLDLAGRYGESVVEVLLGSTVKGKLVYVSIGRILLDDFGVGEVRTTRTFKKDSVVRIRLGSKVILTFKAK
jgi:hypothetical protein